MNVKNIRSALFFVKCFARTGSTWVLAIVKNRFKFYNKKNLMRQSSFLWRFLKIERCFKARLLASMLLLQILTKGWSFMPFNVLMKASARMADINSITQVIFIAMKNALLVHNWWFWLMHFLLLKITWISIAIFFPKSPSWRRTTSADLWILSACQLEYARRLLRRLSVRPPSSSHDSVAFVIVMCTCPRAKPLAMTSQPWENINS